MDTEPIEPIKLTLFPTASQETKLHTTNERFIEAMSYCGEFMRERGKRHIAEGAKGLYPEVRSKFGLPSGLANSAILSQWLHYRVCPKWSPRSWGYHPVVYSKVTLSFKSRNVVSLATLEGRELISFAVVEYKVPPLGNVIPGRGQLWRYEHGWVEGWGIYVALDFGHLIRVAPAELDLSTPEARLWALGPQERSRIERGLVPAPRSPGRPKATPEQVAATREKAKDRIRAAVEGSLQNGTNWRVFRDKFNVRRYLNREEIENLKTRFAAF